MGYLGYYMYKLDPRSVTQPPHCSTGGFFSFDTKSLNFIPVKILSLRCSRKVDSKEWKRRCCTDKLVVLVGRRGQ